MKLFLDFDGVIVDSIRAYVDTYNLMYNENVRNYYDCNTWDLSDICPKEKNAERIFSSPVFFTNLEFIEGARDSISRLTEHFDVVICSIGTYENIHYKSRWIERNLPFVDNSIFIAKKNVVMDKSIIDMSGSIFVDDSYSNLQSSNAKYKICFGPVKSWNEQFTGLRYNSWVIMTDFLIRNFSNAD